MCLGILPALLILYVRARVEDPEVYREAKAKADDARGAAEADPLREAAEDDDRRLAARDRHPGRLLRDVHLDPDVPEDGARPDVVGTSGYLFVVIAGAFLGYLTAGCVHDRLGRRQAFALFAALAGVVAGRVLRSCRRARTRRCCSSASRSGFFASGCFSGFGSYLAELYPTRARGDRRGLLLQRRPRHSARCSRASSASSRRPSGSAARSPSACSATCSRSARCGACRRPTGARSGPVE